MALLSRKELRDWFKQALSPYQSTLGQVYTARVVEFESEDAQPEAFTSVFVSEGQINQEAEGLAALTYTELEIGFALKHGSDDDLDRCEEIADRAIADFQQIKPPKFSFYKTRFAYSGQSEEAYQQLYISFQIIYA